MKIHPRIISAAAATIAGAAILTTPTGASTAPETATPGSLQHESGQGPLPDDGTTIITFEDFEESVSESLQPYSEYSPQVFTFGSS